jgi:hypothetical protein
MYDLVLLGITKSYKMKNFQINKNNMNFLLKNTVKLINRIYYYGKTKEK